MLPRKSFLSNPENAKTSYGSGRKSYATKAARIEPEVDMPAPPEMTAEAAPHVAPIGDEAGQAREHLAA
jgi:hypothetical protein